MKNNDDTQIDLFCSEYLLAQLGIERIIDGLSQRYISLGEIKGNFVLENPTEYEKSFLRGLFKRDFSGDGDIKISLKKFEKSFNNTKFEGIQLKKVLNNYYGYEIITNKTATLNQRIQFNDFFDELLSKCSYSPFINWLKVSLDNSRPGIYKWLILKYKNDSLFLSTTLLQLEKLVILLECNQVSLLRPIAAAKITKNPHSLDDDKDLLKGYIYYLCFKYDEPDPITAVEKITLLERGNLLLESVNRTILTYGLMAEGNNQDTLGWEHFYKRDEPLVITLDNLTSVGCINTCDSIKKAIYCFENPSIFYSFINKFPNIAAICTSGQLNSTGYKLFELLETTNIKIYYHGDYDPEGLLIAEKLVKQFYNIELFGYTTELYLKSISSNRISESRLKQMNNINNVVLLELVKLIFETKQAGYEEYIVDDLFTLVN